MPTISKSQAAPPLRGQIGESSGTRSPIFHLNRSMSARPTIAPVRVFSHACLCVSGSTYSGYIARNGSGSTGKLAKKFFDSFW